MSNRRKIERFAKQNNVKLLHCEFVRNMEYYYGDSCDASSWAVDIEIDGRVEQYDSYYGLGVDGDVERMLCEIKHDIEEARQNNAE
jgi:hypothetical protein